MKLGAKSAPAPAETPDAAPADMSSADDSADDSQDNLFGADSGADTTPTDAPSNDKPFDDEPFDAGVKADEESDPKKFIEQLTGKLGQSLRKYNEEQGTPDLELEKFAINSLLSATHTAEMDAEDQKDIIKKVKSAGKGDEDAEMAADDSEEPTDDMGDEPSEEPTNDMGGKESAEEPADDDNLFETEMLDEMSLNDWKSKALIKLYDEGDENMKRILNRMISFNDNVNRNQFIKDLQEDHDNEDIEYVIGRLQELGVQLPDVGVDLKEANIFLNNPPKNNMFQEGSNDILDEACWKGYKQVGMKTKNGKEVPNCVKINEAASLEEKDDRCTRIAKRKYDVWPSAYASGAVVKCRQGKIWKNVDESYLDELETLEEKWSAKYKKSIDCNNPKGFSQKAHCQGRKKHG